MPRYFDIRSFALNSGGYVNVTVPIECRRLVIDNTDLTNSIYARVEEGGAEKEIPAGQELDITSNEASFLPENGPVCALRSVTATSTAVVTYTR